MVLKRDKARNVAYDLCGIADTPLGTNAPAQRGVRIEQRGIDSVGDEQHLCARYALRDGVFQTGDGIHHNTIRKSRQQRAEPLFYFGNQGEREKLGASHRPKKLDVSIEHPGERGKDILRVHPAVQNRRSFLRTRRTRAR